MNRTKNLSAACSLGLIAALGSATLAEGADDPRVRVVELLGDSGYPDIQFSDQGDTLVLTREASGGIELSVHRDQDWELVKRVIGGDVFALRTFGVSDDGTVIAETDFENVNLIEGLVTTVFPRSWYDSENGFTGWRLQGEVLSGDGLHVGVNGTPTDGFYTDAFLWDGESRFIDISRNLIQERRTYRVRGLSFDGTVGVFSADYQAPLNNIRSIGTERDVWVWEDGELTMVPRISASYEVVMRATEISGNGQAVLGSAEGLWHHGFDDERIYDGESYDLIRSPWHSWVWTREGGTVEIEYPARFESIGVWDITDDATVVLGNGFSPDTGIQQFLWYRSENQFVMIDDLFTKLGITIDADWFTFTQISGDGSKLLGVLNRDRRYSALIVTIPVRGGR
jgi:hypothetical protein